MAASPLKMAGMMAICVSGFLLGAPWSAAAVSLTFLALPLVWPAPDPAMARAYAIASDFLRAVASTALVAFILVFLAVMTLMACGLGTFAIMAGSGFDFDLASQGSEGFEQAMAAYQDTPGWQLSLVVSLLAVALFAGAVARSVPFSAASAKERRVVALEAFNWTRKRAVLLACGVSVFVAVPAGLAVASGGLPGPLGQVAAGAFAFAAIAGWHAVSASAYKRFAPEA